MKLTKVERDNIKSCTEFYEQWLTDLGTFQSVGEMMKTNGQTVAKKFSNMSSEHHRQAINNAIRHLKPSGNLVCKVQLCSTGHTSTCYRSSSKHEVKTEVEIEPMESAQTNRKQTVAKTTNIVASLLNDFHTHFRTLYSNSIDTIDDPDWKEMESCLILTVTTAGVDYQTNEYIYRYRTALEKLLETLEFTPELIKQIWKMFEPIHEYLSPIEG